MCRILQINRSGFYKYKEPEDKKDEHTQLVCKLFRDNLKAYGTRRIKQEAQRQGVRISRRRIARIMRSEALVSSYTIAKYKVHSSKVNDELVSNHVDRKFNGREVYEVVVSDLTYVRVGSRWNFICTLMDLHNREIVGFSCGPYKDAQLVQKAFSKIKTNLLNIEYFHTDRGNEFKNKLIDEVLETFKIKRSLSKKGTPYDNAVAEATFKSIKTEFVYANRFETLQELEVRFSAYVWWFNNKRLHSTLGYLPPVEYRAQTI